MQAIYADTAADISRVCKDSIIKTTLFGMTVAITLWKEILPAY